MGNVTRNLGRDGITSMAISAVDVALWDLKGKILDQPVCALLGAARERVPIYGSGGFTSYTIEQLCAQLHGWVTNGIPWVKMKVGRENKAGPPHRTLLGNAKFIVEELYFPDEVMDGSKRIFCAAPIKLRGSVAPGRGQCCGSSISAAAVRTPVSAW